MDNAIAMTIELGPETTAKLDRILAALPAAEPTQSAAAPIKLTDEELADVLLYCAQLTRIVSHRDAVKYFRFNFDGAVIDTLRGLAMLYDGTGQIKTGDDFKRDELYGPTFREMREDLRAYLERLERGEA